MKVIRQIMLIVSCFVFLFLFVGCSAITNIMEPKEKELVCDEEDFSVTIPQGWEEAYDLNEDASIQASNLRKDIHFAVIVEPKYNFSDDYTLADYDKTVYDNYYEVLDNIDIGKSTETEIDSFPAIQTLVTGEVDELNVTYLVTIVETQNRFFQVVAWSLQESFDEHSEELHEITNSIIISDTEVTVSEKTGDKDSYASKKLKTITSTDDVCSVSVSDEWEESYELSDEASIQVENNKKEVYFIVISESKDDVLDSIMLEDYKQLVIDTFCETLKNADIHQSVETKVDSFPATQTVVSGEFEKIKIVYLLTLVESQDHIFQVLAWGPRKSFEEYSGELHEITNSLVINDT